MERKAREEEREREELSLLLWLVSYLSFYSIFLFLSLPSHLAVDTSALLPPLFSLSLCSQVRDALLLPCCSLLLSHGAREAEEERSHGGKSQRRREGEGER